MAGVVLSSQSRYARPQTATPQQPQPQPQVNYTQGPTSDPNAEYLKQRQAIMDRQAAEEDYRRQSRDARAQMEAQARMQRQSFEQQAGFQREMLAGQMKQEEPAAPEPAAPAAPMPPMMMAAPQQQSPVAPGAGWEYGQLGGVTPQGLGQSRAPQGPMQTFRQLRQTGVY